MEIKKLGIVQTPSKEIRVELLKWNMERRAYLVRFPENEIHQWIPETMIKLIGEEQ